MGNPNKTLCLAVLSGKGGVGKTNIALNLGYALYAQSQAAMLMDCDLGLANLDVMLGISPDKNLQDLLTPGVSPAEVVYPLEKNGLDLLPAASGVPELVEMDEEQREELFRKLRDLLSRYGYLILDLGAGISPTVLSFASMAHLRLVVVTPEPTSLTDGYALMKVLVTKHQAEEFHVVVNDASTIAEAKATFARLAAACKKFLDIEPVYLGAVRHDRAVPDSVRKQTPLLKNAPRSGAARDILALSQAIMKYREQNQGFLSASPLLSNFPLGTP